MGDEDEDEDVEWEWGMGNGECQDPYVAKSWQYLK
jgi:hypothetical protein